MIKWICFLLFIIFQTFLSSAQTVTNAVSRQEQNSIIISYNLETTLACEISLYVSINGGSSWDGPLKMVKGDVGDKISSGEHSIIWSVLEEYKELRGDNIKFQVRVERIQSEVIGNPIRIRNFQVAQNDFPSPMTWIEAKKACVSLGDGWHLPTKHQLHILYKYKHKIGAFNHYFYWSSTEGHDEDLWGQSFSNGKQNWHYKNDESYVRAVRAFSFFK